MEKRIGIDIGGTKCAVILGETQDGIPVVLKKETFKTTDFPTPELAIERFCLLIRQLSNECAEKIESIGVSCGGPLDSHNGVILSPPNLPGWDRVEIVRSLKERFDVPVFLQNDANACALAEWKYGAGRGCSNFIFLTFGTGLGAGLILNGQLHTGCDDMAGELGHWQMSRFGPVGYGKVGSFEGFCSGGGIAQLASQAIYARLQAGHSHPLQPGKLTTKEVFELAAQGDPVCGEVCRMVGEYLGRGLALLIDLLNPEVIVAGSIFTRNYNLLHPIAISVVEQQALAVPVARCRVLPSELGESIGDFAALAVAGGTTH